MVTLNQLNLKAGGDVGTSTVSRFTTTSNEITLTTGDDAFVGVTGNTKLHASTITDDLDFQATGTITSTGPTVTDTFTVESTGGSILDVGDVILNFGSTGDSVLKAAGTIGTDTDAVEVNVTAGTLSVSAASAVNGSSINIMGTVNPSNGLILLLGSYPGLVSWNGTPLFIPNGNGGLSIMASSENAALYSAIYAPYVMNRFVTPNTVTPLEFQAESTVMAQLLYNNQLPQLTTPIDSNDLDNPTQDETLNPKEDTLQPSH